MAHDLKKKWRSDDVKIKENADFSSLLLSERVLAGLTKAGFRRPSPIQFEAIPIGRYGIDLLVQAKSGTGKTLVFTILALEKLQPKLSRPQVLIMVPTREIATQICSVIKLVGSSFPKLTCYSFIGGLSVEEDKTNAYTCQIAVGTPGRLKQLIQLGCLPTSSIRLFVLDEADQLLENSFKQAIEDIFNVLPKDKQVVATSATFPPRMKKLLYNYLVEPHIVSLSAKKLALLGIVHYAKVVPNSLMPFMTYKYKLEAIEKIVKKLRYSQCLIFCNSLAKVELLCRDIKKWGFSTTYISSSKDQVDRLKAMERLKQFKCKILVSSDVAARGIDAENVDLVINFEIPTCTETYLHRAGRAGRFGSHGVTISLLNNKEIKSMEDMEVEGGFKTYKLPDLLPSNLIRNPVFEEPLIEYVKSGSPPDANLCRNENTDECNGKQESDKVLCDTATLNEDARLVIQSRDEEYSNNNNNKLKNGTGEDLKPDDVLNSACKSDASLAKAASPKKIAFKQKVICSEAQSVSAGNYPNGNAADVSAKHIPDEPLIEISKNASESQCSRSIAPEKCQDTTETLESISEDDLKAISPVEEESVKHEISSSNVNANHTTSERDHVCTNPTSDPNCVPEVMEQSTVNGNAEMNPLYADIEQMMNNAEMNPLYAHIEQMLNKAERHIKMSKLVSTFLNPSKTITEEKNTQDSSNLESEDRKLHLTSLIKTRKVYDYKLLVSPDSVCNVKLDNPLALRNVHINLPLLSPEAVIEAKYGNLPKTESSSEQSHNDNVVNKITDGLNKSNELSGDLLTDIDGVGQFPSYEEYDLCHTIKSYLQGYKKSKKDALSVFEKQDDSNTAEHVANNNCVLAEKMINLVSDKSEFNSEVFKTYLQDEMISNEPDGSKIDKRSDLLIKYDQNEKSYACSCDIIEQETVSVESEKTSEILYENSKSHVEDQMTNNGEDAVKFDIKSASTSGRGDILFYNPDLDDSDSGLVLTSHDKMKSDATSMKLNCYSDSSLSSSNENAYLNKQIQQKRKDSSSDTESSSASSTCTPSQSKKRYLNNFRRSDSSSDSESSYSSNNSDSSTHRRNTKATRKVRDNYHESDSSSDSEYDSSSSDSDSSSRKRNIQSKKRNFYENDSSSDSESSSSSSDTHSSSYRNKTHSRKNKIGNHNPCNTFHMEHNNFPSTSFSSATNNYMSDSSKYLPGLIETPYQQYSYSYCKHAHMSKKSPTKQLQICAECAKYHHIYCCAQKNHKHYHNSSEKGCNCRKGHKYANNVSSNPSVTNYSKAHSHTRKCYMPSSHRCHPMLTNVPCNKEICAQWYNMFYTQWMCIRRHANLPY